MAVVVPDLVAFPNGTKHYCCPWAIRTAAFLAQLSLYQRWVVVLGVRAVITAPSTSSFDLLSFLKYTGFVVSALPTIWGLVAKTSFEDEQ